MSNIMDHVKHLRDLLYKAEEYVIDGVTRAKEEAKMNKAYPMRSPRFDAALEEVRRLHAEISTVLRSPIPEFENYREPGEFGEGATVRRAEPAIDRRTCGTAELAAANPNVMSYVTEREDEIERLKQDRYRLAYAITGGEDAPGLLDSLTTDQLVEIARGNVARHMGDIDRLVALEETLRKIAAYDDAAANAYLRATGSYRCFDEPRAVEMARGVLEGGSC